MAPVRYYQLLNQLLGSESALAYNSVVVGRLTRVRTRKPLNPSLIQRQ
ncbi:MAG: DUF3263 domain-containing protein [Mycobacterium sp.]